MSKNLPTGVLNNISYGPARIFLGPTGATPTTEVGYIAAEDGVKFRVTTDRGEVRQGSPSLPIMHYDKMQDLEVEFTGIEWNIDLLLQVLGVGVTLPSGTGSKLGIGGDSTVTGYALQVRHRMPASTPAATINVNLWDAAGDGNLELAFTEDHHKIPFKFKARRSATNWAGADNPEGSELGEIVRQIA